MVSGADLLKIKEFRIPTISSCMKSKDEILDIARQTLQIEAQTLLDVERSLDEDFFKVVETVYKSKGRLVISGIGKSANIANKMVATLNSTGTPAIFMHAADAIHGDLGNVQKDDVVICISKSGDTPEIKVLVPILKEMGNALVGMCSNKDSFLGKHADLLLYTPVHKEACPNNLAPTSSTTAQLAMGDALAVCLLELKDFKAQDFARYHPGGALGKKLYLRVADLYPQHEKPYTSAKATLSEVILEISSKRLGATVVGENDEIEGIITDGDLRRKMSEGKDLRDLIAADLMTKDPKTILPDMLAADAISLMKEKGITQLVVAENSKYLGMVHLHDILKEGIL